jgi:predicted metal-dependent HD superfamily phosphohydrolase
MGVHDAPQWLLSAYQRSVLGAGATATVEEIRDAGQTLIDRWSSPGRDFHNLKHLVDVLVRVDELVEETHEPDLVRLAAWYHGAIFDSADAKTYANRGGEDEIASARLAYEELTKLGVPERRAHRVHDLVVALVRHSPDPADFDCAVLCDADLAMLAAEPQRYKAYLHDVRAEYAHLPIEDYVRARLRILHKLLARPSLFSSPLGAAWEEPARQNVSAELQRLEKELGKINAAKDAAAGVEGATNGATDDATARAAAAAARSGDTTGS